MILAKHKKYSGIRTGAIYFLDSLQTTTSLFPFSVRWEKNLYRLHEYRSSGEQNSRSETHITKKGFFPPSLLETSPLPVGIWDISGSEKTTL